MAHPEISYYKGALLAPIAVPFIVAPFLGKMGGILAMSWLSGGIPYLLWCLAMLYWGRNQPIRRIRIAGVLAPMTFFLVFALAYACLVAVTQNRGERIDFFQHSIGFFAVWILLIGYGWVLLILGGWQLVSRLRSAASPSRPESQPK
jgi:hypothetical protein